VDLQTVSAGSGITRLRLRGAPHPVGIFYGSSEGSCLSDPGVGSWRPLPGIGGLDPVRTLATCAVCRRDRASVALPSL